MIRVYKSSSQKFSYDILINNRFWMELVQKLRFYIALATIFLIPLLFNPFSNDIFNTIKGVLLIFFTAVMLLLWGIDSIIKKRFELRMTWINKIILIIFGIATITIIGNTTWVNSLLGQSGSTGINNSLFGLNATLGTGYITLVTMCVLYFVISMTINTKERIIIATRVLSITGVIVMKLSLIRYLFPNLAFHNGFDIILKGYNLINPAFPTTYPSQNFATIGEYYLMPVFLLICLLFTFGNVLNHKHAKSNFYYYFDILLLAILSFGFIITTWNNVYSYVFYGIGAIAILALFIKDRTSLSVYKNTPKRDSLGIISVILGFMIGILILMIGNINQVTSPLAPIDASWVTTFSTMGSSFKNGALGIGPENFGTVFSQSRPLSLNATSLLFEDLPHAGNFVMEIMTCFGILGFCAFLYIAFIFLMFFLKNKTGDPYIFTFMIVLLSTFVSLFFVPLNLTLLFTLFVLSGLFSSIISLKTNSVQTFILSTSNKNKNGIAHIIFGSASVIIFLISSVFAFNLFSSNVSFSQSIQQITDPTNDANLNNALIYNANAIQSFSYADNYYNRYASLVFQKYTNLTTAINKRIIESNKNKPADAQNIQPQLTTQEQSDVQSFLDVLVANVEKSIQVNPVNYQNYYLGARIYFELSKNFQGQSLEKVKDYINKAISLDPQNPVPYILASDISLIKNDITSAQNYLMTSLNKYPSIDAFSRLAQIYQQTKQYDAALNVLKTAQLYQNKDSDIYKQLDQAIAQIADQKKNDPTLATPTPTVTPLPTPTKITTITKKK